MTDNVRRPTSNLRPRTFRVLEQAVETGVSLGYRRAHKHVDNPSESDVTQAVAAAVMAEISEWFIYDDEE